MAFVCDQCQKTFTRNSNLQRHIKSVHLLIKPFRCAHCDAAYKRKVDLEGHMRSVHLKIKPFHCPYKGCDVAFARAEQMRVHRKTHQLNGDVLDERKVQQTQKLPTPKNSIETKTKSKICNKRKISQKSENAKKPKSLSKSLKTSSKSSPTSSNTSELHSNNDISRKCTDDLLVVHEDHVDALIGGRLMGFVNSNTADGGAKFKLEEHSLGSAVEQCQHEIVESHVFPSSPSTPLKKPCSDHGHNECLESVLLAPSEYVRHEHEKHTHSENCGHYAVFHDDHIDYLVGHHLHYVNEDGGCENHGHLRVVSRDSFLSSLESKKPKSNQKELLVAASDLLTLF